MMSTELEVSLDSTFVSLTLRGLNVTVGNTSRLFPPSPKMLRLLDLGALSLELVFSSGFSILVRPRVEPRSEAVCEGGSVCGSEPQPIPQPSSRRRRLLEAAGAAAGIAGDVPSSGFEGESFGESIVGSAS
mmetsp:Transcript_30366/g.60997  ORF Transcript_30366/g.60997 Transcript_30366/m.60997 type:complete len:131 (-) Transcript_30366:3767-4159(-)